MPPPCPGGGSYASSGCLTGCEVLERDTLFERPSGNKEIAGWVAAQYDSVEIGDLTVYDLMPPTRCPGGQSPADWLWCGSRGVDTLVEHDD